MARTPVTQWRRKDKKRPVLQPTPTYIAALYMCSIITMSNDIPFITGGFFKVFWERIKLIWYGLNSNLYETLEVWRKNTDWSSEKWIAKRSFAIYILDLVKPCSKKRKEDTAKIDCLNIVPIHPAFFKLIFTAAKWQSVWIKPPELSKNLDSGGYVSKCMNVCCAM